MKVAVLIPAYREAERIEATVIAALSIEGVNEVVVVDDGSGDDTADIAERAGATVVRLNQNCGKGAAMEAGCEAVAEYDVVLLLDGDLAGSAAQGSLLLEPVLAGKADMSVAKFPKPTGKAGFGLVKGLARDGIAKMGGGFLSEAPLSGQRAVTKECLCVIRPFAAGYGVEVALTIRALRAGLTVVEIPTTMSHAATGRDLAGFIHRGKQFLDVAKTLFRLHFIEKN